MIGLFLTVITVLAKGDLLKEVSNFRFLALDEHFSDYQYL